MLLKRNRNAIEPDISKPSAKNCVYKNILHRNVSLLFSYVSLLLLTFKYFTETLICVSVALQCFYIRVRTIFKHSKNFLQNPAQLRFFAFLQRFSTFYLLFLTFELRFTAFYLRFIAYVSVPENTRNAHRNAIVRNGHHQQLTFHTF